MKTKCSIFLAITVILFGCNKIDPQPTGEAENFTTKSITTSGTKVAEKVNGIVICTIDEDILKSAVSDYYGAIETKRLVVKEGKKNTPNNYYVLKGRVKNGNIIHRYAFELVPLELTNGDVELYLPQAGTEQHVLSTTGCKCKLKVTSSSTGRLVPVDNCCACTYSTSVSTNNQDTEGTMGLIHAISAILFP
jgi:hypothetical protein